MHYYRYRPYSEISLKELIYSEMYFSSPEECNDPFDSKTFYTFINDKPKWSKLVLLASERIKISISEDLLSQLAEYICCQCPLTFDEATNRDLFNGFNTSKPAENILINYLLISIREILKLYSPSTRYFVSFSKNNIESLMWSHYADKHKGFCLIFKAINGAINVAPNYKKDSVRRETTNGIAPAMSYGMPDIFEFVDIDYKAEVEYLNAFLHMPVYVSGNAESKEEQLKIVAQQESHYSQKGQNWFYEDESRLILKPPHPWLFGGHIEYTKQERLFHYEPSQLAGIIYGARMTMEEKNRVREILKERRNFINRTVNYKRTVFDFIEFEAKLSTNQRNVEVKPVAILSYQTIPTTDKNFDRLYTDWKEGIGWETEGGHSKRVKVD